MVPYIRLEAPPTHIRASAFSHPSPPPPTSGWRHFWIAPDNSNHAGNFDMYICNRTFTYAVNRPTRRRQHIPATGTLHLYDAVDPLAAPFSNWHFRGKEDRRIMSFISRAVLGPNGNGSSVYCMTAYRRTREESPERFLDRKVASDRDTRHGRPSTHMVLYRRVFKGRFQDPPVQYILPGPKRFKTDQNLFFTQFLSQLTQMTIPNLFPTKNAEENAKSY